MKTRQEEIAQTSRQIRENTEKLFSLHMAKSPNEEEENPRERNPGENQGGRGKENPKEKTDRETQPKGDMNRWEDDDSLGKGPQSR